MNIELWFLAKRVEWSEKYFRPNCVEPLVNQLNVYTPNSMCIENLRKMLLKGLVLTKTIIFVK